MPRCRSEESQLARRAKQLLKLQAAASEVEVESSGAAASAAQSFETRGSTSMTSKAGEENEAGENVKESGLSGAAASAAQCFETRGSTSMTSKAGDENEAGENVKESGLSGVAIAAAQNETRGSASMTSKAEEEKGAAASAALGDEVAVSVHGLPMPAEMTLEVAVHDDGFVGVGVASEATHSVDVSSIVKLVVRQVALCLPDMVRAPIKAMMDIGWVSMLESLPTLIAKIIDKTSSGSVGAPAPDTCALERRVALLEGRIVALQTRLYGLGLEESEVSEDGVGVPSSLATMTSEDEETTMPSLTSEEAKMIQLHQLTVAMAAGDPEDEATQLAQAYLEVQANRMVKSSRRKEKQKKNKVRKTSEAAASCSHVQHRADAQ